MGVGVGVCVWGGGETDGVGGAVFESASLMSACTIDECGCN